jgi:hypothetical protein
MGVHGSGPTEAQEGVGQERGGEASEQADEGLGAMACRAQAVGELAAGGLDPIARGGHGRRTARGSR